MALVRVIFAHEMGMIDPNGVARLQRVVTLRTATVIVAFGAADFIVPVWEFRGRDSGKREL